MSEHNVPAAPDSGDDEVLVEGTYFPRAELPTVLGNFMRSCNEYARAAKDEHIRRRAAVAQRDALQRQVDADLGEVVGRCPGHALTHCWPCGWVSDAEWREARESRRSALAGISSLRAALSGGDTPAQPDPLAVECPTCKAPPTWGCLNRATGDERHTPHGTRRPASPDPEKGQPR